jgi:hypothetical protein
MLDISVTIQGDKVIIEGLGKLTKGLPSAVQRGLERAAIGIYRGAFTFLSGAGAKGTTTGTAVKEGGKRKIKGQKWTPQNISAGGYPVPVRTGWLRRSLNWLKPGESKTGEAGTFKAGPNEVVIYNSAAYANIIHEGRGSSAKFGPRRFLTDALTRFNQGDKIKTIIEEEIQKAKAKAGL